ncbi:ribosome recycling factor [bacterium]|nr:ribosome recycling factor [bacterium]
MIKSLHKETQNRMESAVNATMHEFGTIRTGRASVSLLDGIKVDYYNTVTPLNQMSTISIPEPRLMVIQPWDPSILSGIEKAILKSDLGLNPTNDGKVIRLAIPMLTEERRKQLVKVVKNMAEESRISIRNARRDSNEKLKNMEKDRQITEDEYHNGLKEIQKLTDEFIAKVDEILEKKEKEIMEV